LTHHLRRWPPLLSAADAPSKPEREGAAGAGAGAEAEAEAVGEGTFGVDYMFALADTVTGQVRGRARTPLPWGVRPPCHRSLRPPLALVWSRPPSLSFKYVEERRLR